MFPFVLNCARKFGDSTIGYVRYVRSKNSEMKNLEKTNEVPVWPAQVPQLFKIHFAT